MSAPAPPVVMLLAVLLLTKVTFTAEVKALALIVPTPALLRRDVDFGA
jgi:hypothetical protein